MAGSRLIVPEDPLAQKAETWLKDKSGAACRRCGVNIDLGHRYYAEANGLIHYACKAREEVDLRAIGF